MKTILVTILLMAINITIAQNLEYNSKTDKMEIKHIVEVDSISAGDLYSIGKKWIKKTYSNPSSVIKSDIEFEMIRGNGAVIDGIKFKAGNGTLKYIFTFDFKENKVRLVYTDFTIRLNAGTYPAKFYFYKKNGDKRKESSQSTAVKYGIESNILSLIKDFENTLKYGFDDSGDDW